MGQFNLFRAMRAASQNPKFRFTKAEKEWMGESNLVPRELIEEGEVVCGIRVGSLAVLQFCGSARLQLWGRGRACKTLSYRALGCGPWTIL